MTSCSPPPTARCTCATPPRPPPPRWRSPATSPIRPRGRSRCRAIARSGARGPVRATAQAPAEARARPLDHARHLRAEALAAEALRVLAGVRAVELESLEALDRGGERARALLAEQHAGAPVENRL